MGGMGRKTPRMGDARCEVPSKVLGRGVHGYEVGLCAWFSALGEAVLVVFGHAVYGFVAGFVDDGGIDGGGLDLAVAEEFGYGVEVGSCHECHGGTTVACGVEGDMLADSCFCRPFCDGAFDGGQTGHSENEVFGAAHLIWEPSNGFDVEFVVDGFLCLLHDDGVAIGVACLFDVFPLEFANVAESQACEATEHETAFDLVVVAVGVGESAYLVGIEIFLDYDGALWHVAFPHPHDGVGDDGLVYHGFVEDALEGTEVVVGGDARECFPRLGSGLLEVFGKAFAEVEVDVFHLDVSGFGAEIGGEVVGHVAAGVGVTVASMALFGGFQMVLQILEEPHFRLVVVERDACLSVGDFDDSFCLDGLGCLKGLPVHDFGFEVGFGNQVEFQKLVGSASVVVGVEVDGLVSADKSLESDFDRFFSFGGLIFFFHDFFCQRYGKIQRNKEQSVHQNDVEMEKSSCFLVLSQGKP